MIQSQSCKILDLAITMPGCSHTLDIPINPALSWGQAPKPPFSLRSFSNWTGSAIERSENGGLGGTPRKESVDDGPDRYSRGLLYTSRAGQKPHLAAQPHTHVRHRLPFPNPTQHKNLFVFFLTTAQIPDTIYCKEQSTNIRSHVSRIRLELSPEKVWQRRSVLVRENALVLVSQQSAC